MPEAPASEGSLTIAQGEAALEKMPGSRAEDKPEEEQTEAAHPQDSDSPPAADNQESDQQEAKGEETAPEASGEQEEQEEEGEEGEVQGDWLFPVKLGGKDVPMPVKELANGYMRNADYTQGK